MEISTPNRGKIDGEARFVTVELLVEVAEPIPDIDVCSYAMKVMRSNHIFTGHPVRPILARIVPTHDAVDTTGNTGQIQQLCQQG